MRESMVFLPGSEALAPARSKPPTRARWRHRALALGLLALLFADPAWAAITAGKDFYYVVEGDVFDFSSSLFQPRTEASALSLLGQTAAGTTSASAVEMATVEGVFCNPTIFANHWYYGVDIWEAGVNTVGAGPTYKAELIRNQEALSVVYFKNAIPNVLSAEVVTCRWDIGTSPPPHQSYVVKVSPA